MCSPAKHPKSNDSDTLSDNYEVDQSNSSSDEMSFDETINKEEIKSSNGNYQIPCTVLHEDFNSFIVSIISSFWSML